MLNVNKWLSDALAVGGVELDCSEEPMRKNVGEKPYITWEHGTSVPRYAGGDVFENHYPVRLYLWLPPTTESWQEILAAMEKAVALYDGNQAVACYIRGSTGATDAPAIGRKAVQLDLTIVERLWNA